MPLPKDRFRLVQPRAEDAIPGNQKLQQARRELTAVVENALAARTTGLPAVRVGWTEETYAKMVGAGHKIVGFLPTRVFAHPSNVGAIEKVKELKRKWEAGEIYFADATTDDKRRAERCPRRVFPGKQLEASSMHGVHFDFKLPPVNFSRPPDMSTPRPKEVVLRPITLMPCYELPIADAPHPDALSRMQRSDTKKSRSRMLRGSRRGLTTAPFIAVSPTKHRGEPSVKRQRAVPTHDRIDRYYVPEGREDESDPIENAWDPVEAVESDPIEEWVVAAEGTGKWKRKMRA